MTTDDRDSDFYGSKNVQNTKFNQSMIWIPVAIGISIAAGVLTTRGIQRLMTKGTQTISSSTTNGTANGAKFTESVATHMKYTARTTLGKLPYGGNFKEPMDISEAALILGCRETSSKKIINQRFQQAMKSNHPDQGGSPYFATKLNEAKQLISKNKE